jgi:riboflavin synthase
MFTGIVERTGKVLALDTGSYSQSPTAIAMKAITRLAIRVGENFPTTLGDSVAVNGCCLTVTSHENDTLTFDVSGETLAKTSLGHLREGSEVNLERALRVGDRLGGHIVSGHVDGTGQVFAVDRKSDGWELIVELSQELGRYCIPKGSICLDGISLTINKVEDKPGQVLVSIRLIPTTVDVTTFKHLRSQQVLNIEVDSLGKYIERLMKPLV